MGKFAWPFEYAVSQARLVLTDKGRFHSHDFVCDVLAPILEELDNLLAERAEREKNPGVWDGVPDDADTAYVAFGNSERGSPLFVDKRHTRILPKTKAREIAERYSCDTATCHPMIDGNRAVDVIESAILEALQSEGKK